MWGRASIGQDPDASPLGSASFINALVDMANRRDAGGGPPVSLPISATTIEVKNITGADRAAGEVLEIGTHLLTDVDRRNLIFNADTVSHTGGRSYCILPRPIPNGKIDDGVISGVCVAKVDIQATTDRYAYVTVSSNVLKSGPAGQFKLLGPVSSTGEHEIGVVFADGGRLFRIGRSGGAVAKGATGTFTLYEFNGTSVSSTGLTVTARAFGTSINAAKYVFLFWVDGEWMAACWE